jgi:alkanesulfonate monooxygenase SsuD/methylene tetrahydromethanopterin reductase-like flavin-dependent oxidoreductase (luciferase family)
MAAQIVLLLPLYNPIRLAEDLAILDLTSGGRASYVFAGGYRYEEFAIFDVDIRTRGRLMEEMIDVVTKAWTGEEFSYNGQSVQILPRPKQDPRPRFLLGGSSAAAARRAARLADGFLPSAPNLDHFYEEALAELGKPPPKRRSSPSSSASTAPRADRDIIVAVSSDPDRAWETVGPFCLHENNTYAEWIRAGRGAVVPMYEEVPDIITLRSAGPFAVLTPEECISLARQHNGKLTVAPITGGIPPALAWETLHAIETDVLPALS